MTNVSGYAAHHKIIIVMPDGSKSFYVNSAADPRAKFEDFIVKDLIVYVDSHYRTVPLPRARAVAGLSMGGYGALFLGLKDYKKFSAVGSFSGAVALAHDPPPPASGTTDAARRTQEMQALFGPAGSTERQD